MAIREWECRFVKRSKVFVVVHAATLEEAEQRLKDGDWEDEQEVDVIDMERTGDPVVFGEV